MEVKCPQCAKIQHGDYCSCCQTNLKSIQLAVTKSQVYYIKAYECTQKRNFQLAKDLLKKAILFDKYNIKAKNLLGLIHFEIGDVGEALKLWIFSRSLCRENNIANEYIEKLSKTPKKFEKYKEAIRLYNIGLDCLMNKNEDVAIIRLKKAIHLNPKFVEAKNLLAASYIAIGQNDKAVVQIQGVLAIDRLNDKALNYLSELTKEKEIEVIQEKMAHTPNVNQGYYYHGVKPQKVISGENGLGKGIVYFMLGAVCMLAVQIALIIPSKTSELEQKVYKLTRENSDMKLQIDTFTRSYKEDILELEKENQLLKKETSTLRENSLFSEQKRKIAQAELCIQKQEWINAADLLNNISESSLEEEQFMKYGELKAKTYPKASDGLYKQAYRDFQEGKYVEANSAFEKVIVYTPTTIQGANSLYYKGEIAEKNNDQAKAIEIYQRVLRAHEGSDAAYKAKKRLDQLNP